MLGQAPALAPVEATRPLLSVRDLSVRFPVRGDGLRVRREVHAVDGVSFDLFPARRWASSVKAAAVNRRRQKL
ncbi:hypothetical protein [Escherichia coli]|uniref:hypothetical protein n=1 Tax=Escherichia coli TaxID=562 RepID=UPI003AB9620C